MLLVLAKEIYVWCLVAEDIILLALKLYIHNVWFQKVYIWKRGSGGGGWGGARSSLEDNDIWKYQIKWNHFHHMGPGFIFSTPLEPFYLFLAYQEPKCFFR